MSLMWRLRQLETNYSLFCTSIQYTVRLVCRHSLLSWSAIWSIKAGVTHTNTQRSVCLPGLTQRVCLTLRVWWLYIWNGEELENRTNHRAFLPLSSITTPRGTNTVLQSFFHHLLSLNHSLVFSSFSKGEIHSLPLGHLSKIWIF